MLFIRDIKIVGHKKKNEKVKLSHRRTISSLRDRPSESARTKRTTNDVNLKAITLLVRERYQEQEYEGGNKRAANNAFEALSASGGLNKEKNVTAYFVSDATLTEQGNCHHLS